MCGNGVEDRDPQNIWNQRNNCGSFVDATVSEKYGRPQSAKLQTAANESSKFHLDTLLLPPTQMGQRDAETNMGLSSKHTVSIWFHHCNKKLSYRLETGHQQRISF